nr:tail fiber protein [Xenorhabdus sp. KK7.4]
MEQKTGTSTKTVISQKIATDSFARKELYAETPKSSVIKTPNKSASLEIGEPSWLALKNEATGNVTFAVDSLGNIRNGLVGIVAGGTGAKTAEQARVNLGLAETVEQAKNAVPKSSITQFSGNSPEQVMSQKVVTSLVSERITKSEADGKYQLKGSFGFGGNGGTNFGKNNNEFLAWIRRSNASPEFFRNSINSDYTHIHGAGLLLKAADVYASLSVNYATARVKIVAGNNSGTANSPVKELAFTDDSYNKSESDNRFIRLNTNTKTSGYILSKAANIYDDPSSRDLGRSGFLRPNGVDNLGSLAIHVAHPLVDGPKHSRGISFSYGSSGSERFRISTYAFDENGKFQGQKRILTEDDKDSLGSVPVGVPLPWPQANPPSGYLICNGERFDKAKCPQLAKAYPSGFLPDLRGEFIRGLDAGRNVDSGRKILSSQEGSIQSHTHSGVFTGAFERESGGRGGWGAVNTNGNTSATGGNETRPRNIAFLYIVKAA